MKTQTLSKVLGLTPILPNEPEAEYQQGLQDLIVELGAQSVLQVYLAEKIYECLWWIRRYEEQKRAMVISEMGVLVNGTLSHSLTKDQIHLRETLLANQVDQKTLEIAAQKGHSIDSLRQLAMTKRRQELLQLDTQIALQAKILAGFQASYEVAYNRKRHSERLDLQNALLRKDLGALESQVANDKPKAKGC